MPILASRSLHTEAVVGLDAATLAWVTAVVANGGSVSDARKTIVNTLIVGLKSDGIWLKSDALWPYAAENEPSALIDLKGLRLATAVSSPTFTIDRGYTGNGSSSYIDSNYNPATQATNYTQNSASIGAWDNTSRVVGATCLMGSETAAFLKIVPLSNFGLNSSAADSFGSDTNSLGFYTISRTASNVLEAYKNGSSTDSKTTASGSINNADIFFLARNDGGTPSSFCSDQISAGYIGGGLSSTEVSNLYARLRTYMTAVGVP